METMEERKEQEQRRLRKSEVEVMKGQDHPSSLDPTAKTIIRDSIASHGGGESAAASEPDDILVFTSSCLAQR
ncbi:hypothetical protein QJS10_CPA05g02402 [Acorus calamus]|uniref:Uncharacterized protein n=1 Tax=Acorus calamus TaxID=4465 RepID=A0AAV9EVT8_ACOCL|nr:hypothetical protein QJS10_CPA05g02402 [Acorus calamus]